MEKIKEIEETTQKKVKESVHHICNDVIGQNWSRGPCPTPPGYRVKNFTREKFEVKNKRRQNLVCLQPPPPLKQNRGGLFPIVCLFIF